MPISQLRVYRVKMNYYDINRKAIHKRILNTYPDMHAEESNSNHLGNALWMLDQLPKFKDQSKIDRWIGCVQGVVHSLGLFSWKELRDLTREDLYGRC